MTDEERADFVREAMGILGHGADRAKVEKAFDKVQHWKTETKREDWSKNLRFGYELTVEQRDAAKKAAAAIRKALDALEPVRDNFLFELQLERAANRQKPQTTQNKDNDNPDDDRAVNLAADITTLENLQRHLQIVGDSKVRPPSKFDPRKLLAVQQAVMLLVAAGKPWSTTRHGDADRLAAALWGDDNPNATTFEQSLLAYRRLRPRHRSVGRSEPGTD